MSDGNTGAAGGMSISRVGLQEGMAAYDALPFRVRAAYDDMPFPCNPVELLNYYRAGGEEMALSVLREHRPRMIAIYAEIIARALSI